METGPNRAEALSDEQLIQEASQFIDTEGKSLELIARELDDTFSGKIKVEKILQTGSLEELQAEAQRQKKAIEVKQNIFEKIFPKQ